ncbi:MAG: HAD-IC family P-type ATPase, partial [Oscillospiraceae bacterium]|nr:HAD-IC family P-type ATPase [Oscillospiraceae bacterium]
MLNEQAVNSSGSNRKVITGLSKEQVLKKKSAGQVNVQPHGITLSVAQIIKKNTLTLFNLINLLIAVAILLVGHIENILFLGVAIGNTAMGIFQELRAKKTLDELSILAKSKVSVLRDGQIVMLYQDEIVLDDIVLIQTGNQICADSVILSSSGLEVDESLLTGESDNIKKNPGDKVMSGSFATAGYAYVKVEAVGRNNYATAITIEAKKEKAPASALMSGINNIIRALTVVIIPLGALLFYNQFSTSGDIGEAVLGASAAMIGMIPEGLILLTGVTMTVGALKLARKKALVQSLPSIETLARVDVLCLDKTGTITDGTLSFESL